MDIMNGLHDFFSGREFSIPLLEVVAFIFFNSFCLLFARYKLGLIVTYCFVFYWGFIFNLNYFIDSLKTFAWGMPIYVLCGVLMLIIAITSFMVQSREYD